MNIHRHYALQLEDNPGTEITWPNPNNLTVFVVSITPSEGFWKGATYHFTLTIPGDYPHTPPKVLCTTRIWHPNIDLQAIVLCSGSAQCRPL